GRKIGNKTLGRFYREHRAKKAEEARKKAAISFAPYVNMMRTIESFEGKVPVGTAEDHRGHVCVTSGGAIFGIVVFVRTNTQYYGVLMPYFDKPEGEAAYDNFLRNDSESLRVHDCEIKSPKGGIVIAGGGRDISWPKNQLEFAFE
ncbi:MAG TPA: hypothetical protein VGY58_12910, partial [Gemmataceae bacterium]|nr:hypothetical protein [Gemmataceae bacterium]